jgi:hypothetical protein
MGKMSTEKMRLYQRARRDRIRGGGAVQTVAGVLVLVRELEERVRELEKELRDTVHNWVKEGIAL